MDGPVEATWLIAVKLWPEGEPGRHIDAYDEYQLTKAEVEKMSSVLAEAGKRGGHGLSQASP